MSASNTPARSGEGLVAILPSAKPSALWPTVGLVIGLSVLGYVLGNLLGASEWVAHVIELVVALAAAAYWLFTNRTGWLTIIAVAAFAAINLLPFGGIDLLVQIAMVVGVWRVNKYLREHRAARAATPNYDTGPGLPGYGQETLPSRTVDPRTWYGEGKQ